MSDDEMLAGYLGVIRDVYGCTGPLQPRLMHGQFHDVVLTGDVACRFARDEESRQQLARHTEVLAALARPRLPFAVPGPVSKVDAGQPLGRCHAALRQLRACHRGHVCAAAGAAGGAVRRHGHAG